MPSRDAFAKCPVEKYVVTGGLEVPEAIKKGEDRELFKQAMIKIGLDVAKSRTVKSMAEALHKTGSAVLMVGSAGLTRALALVCFDRHRSLAPPRHVTGTIVFAVGSRAARSAEQVEALAGEPETSVLRAPNGRLKCIELTASRNLVLKATVDDSGHEGNAEDVAADLARHALDMVRRAHAQALVATGGDTAIAILVASDNPALQVLGDLMPGVPYARIRLDGTSLWLVTKAGGFGGRDTFRDIARRLHAETTPFATVKLSGQ